MNRFLTSVAVVLLPSGVFAADLPSYQPAPYTAPVPVGYTWTGFYLGLQGGYGWGDVEGEASVGAAPDTGPYDYDIDGFVAGVHAGYNYQMGLFVLGAEADVEYSDIGGGGGGVDPTSGAFEHDTEIDWLATFRLRGGLAWDRFMVYATGGAAWADVSQELSQGLVEVSNDDDRWGWTVGGGAEVAFTQNWTGRAEYRYYDFGDEQIGDGATFSDDNDLTFHSVRLGTSYKF